MFDPTRHARPSADFTSVECQNCSDSDRVELWDAANRLVDAGGLAMRATSWISKRMATASFRLDVAGRRLFGQSWDGIEAKARETIESVLWRAQDLATIGLAPPRTRKPRAGLHRFSASASGAVSGFAGLPGLLLDIPVTTTLMLRTIAEIARQHGEDITMPDTRRACLEVLAQASPDAEGEEAELGYWSTRAGLSHMTIAALIRAVAARLGVTVSEQALARAVPMAGAVAGAGLNWVFMRYYQQMAHVHFTIRAVERRTGDQESVRACFDRLVRQARLLKVPRGTRAGPIIDAANQPQEQSGV
jgi:EcsC protein family